MTRITGETARQLLAGITPGPWEATEGGDSIWPVLLYNLGGEVEWENRADQRLAAAAPELAEHVAWLYGRAADDPSYGVHRGRMKEYDQEAVAAHPQSGVVEVYAAHDHGEASAYLSPDEAVDLARALLAAAEEASRGVA